MNSTIKVLAGYTFADKNDKRNRKINILLRTRLLIIYNIKDLWKSHIKAKNIEV